MRIKISLLSSLLLFALGAIVFSSSPQRINAQYPTPTPTPCQVTTNPAVYNLNTGQTGTITASVTSGLGAATVNSMSFGSYNTSIATVNPTADGFSPYSTVVTGVAGGTTAVWATATLSDGRTCPSTGATDTNVNVTGPTPTPSPSPSPSPSPTPSPTPIVCIAPEVPCSACDATPICIGYCAVGSCLTDCSLCGGTPTPTPTVIPTPTPGPTYTVSGNVFVDVNKNQLKDAGESNYSGGITITSTDGSVTYPIPTTNGTFQVYSLPAGSYTISYTSLPTASGYQMTFPVNGPPPFFIVTVGPGCDFGISNSATCDVADNIINLNYGITNSIPWCQSAGGGSIGGDGGFTCTGGGGTGGGGTGGGETGSSCIYDIDCLSGLTCNTSGSTCACSVGSTPGSCDIGIGGAGGGGTGGSVIGVGFNDPIPSISPADAANYCGEAYASIPGDTSTTPGVIFTGEGSANFGQGSASVDKWLVGGTNGYISQGGLVKTSYAYLQSIAKQAGIAPCATGSTSNCIIDLTSNVNYCGIGGLASCNLSASLPHGIYIANGNLTLVGNGSPASYSFPNNQGYIILVNGNLNIQTEIHVPIGSTALFSASGNIIVDKTVGETDYKSTSPNIEGVYSADQYFIVNGTNDCTIGADLRFNAAGNIITNAALNGGTFRNYRDLCENNIYCPVFTVQSRPDFILNAPNFIKRNNYTWQEVAP